MWPFSKFPDAAGSFAGPGRLAPGGGDFSLDNLKAHWALEEASGTRADSHGDNDLTDTSTVSPAGQAAGRVGFACAFSDADGNRLHMAGGDPDMIVKDLDFTLSAWVWIDSKATDRVVASKRAGKTGDEFNIWYNSAADALEFVVGTAGAVGTATGAAGVSTGQWYFLVAWQDMTAGTVNLQIDNGTPVTVARTLGGASSLNGAFALGGDVLTSTLDWEGRIDEVSLWGRVLTADERAALYNGGSGLAYPFTG
jgi:hypothetical protein